MRGQVTDIHQDLIERCRHHDASAQREVYQLYAKAMYNICMRMLANRQDAEDVLQESFVQAFKSINSYKAKATFGAWLKRIVINKCVNHLKKSDRFKWRELNGYDAIESVEDDKPEIDSAAIHDAIKKLPTGCRTVFTLRMLEGYDHEEVAQILDVSVSTSKSQFFRAKELLRASLLNTVESNMTA